MEFFSSSPSHVLSLETMHRTSYRSENMILEIKQSLVVVINFEQKILLKDWLEVPTIQEKKKKKKPLMIHIVLVGYASLFSFLPYYYFFLFFFFFKCIFIHVLEFTINCQLNAFDSQLKCLYSVCLFVFFFFYNHCVLELTRKDVECAFRMLQARFTIVCGPTHLWRTNALD